jgi:TonB family protein
MRPLFATIAFCITVALGFGQSDGVTGDSLEKYRKELETNRSSSLAHYRIAEIYFKQKNYQAAANEFREALNGDLQPDWVEILSHVSLGAIFNLSGQFDRAENEYRLAQTFSRSAPQATANSVVARQLLQKTEPEYSDEARLAGLEGTVQLTGTISGQGVPQDMRVTKSLGLGLDEQALAAIRHWQFIPGTFEDRPLPAPITVPVEFRLPDKQSRWHLIRADFTLPEGVSRPRFSKTTYPYGIGISLRAFEQALVIRAIGREATATVAFDVDERGIPGNLQVLNASHPIWGPEAMAVVREWQFVPGMKYGAPVPVLCTVDLVWGPTNLSQQSLEWAQTQLRASQNPEPPAALLIQAGNGSPRPVVIYQAPDPPYTEAARSAGLEGAVLLSLVVKEDGKAGNIRVIRPLGLGLDERAVEAVSQWLFQPAMVNGKPEAVPVTIEVNFHFPK